MFVCACVCVRACVHACMHAVEWCVYILIVEINSQYIFYCAIIRFTNI